MTALEWSWAPMRIPTLRVVAALVYHQFIVTSTKNNITTIGLSPLVACREPQIVGWLSHTIRNTFLHLDRGVFTFSSKLGFVSQLSQSVTHPSFLPSFTHSLCTNSSNKSLEWLVVSELVENEGKLFWHFEVGCFGSPQVAYSSTWQSRGHFFNNHFESYTRLLLLFGNLHLQFRNTNTVLTCLEESWKRMFLKIGSGTGLFLYRTWWDTFWKKTGNWSNSGISGELFKPSLAQLDEISVRIF